MNNKALIFLLSVITVLALTATFMYAANLCIAKEEEITTIDKDNEIINISNDDFNDVFYDFESNESGEITGDGIDELEEELIENELNISSNEASVNESKETKSNATKSTSSKTTDVKVTTQSSKYNMPYYIKINRTQNVVNIYIKDSSGDYTVPYKAMVCSTGTSTPKAGSKYKITTYRREWNGLKGGVYGQYAVQIVGNILFHSVPYTAKDKSKLEYWEYDKLGTKASLGCIRLAVKDVKWIYDNVGAGTIVEFYEDENPGPLGKPNAQKISDNEECRGWDPTDYVEGNPWHSDNVDTEEISDEIDEINEIYSSGENTEYLTNVDIANDATTQIISGEKIVVEENNAVISGEIIKEVEIETTLETETVNDDSQDESATEAITEVTFETRTISETNPDLPSEDLIEQQKSGD